MHNAIPMMIRQTARRWSGKYKGTSPDDIEQELHLWCLTQGIDGAWHDDDTLTEEECGTLYRKDLSSLQWAAERYCRRDKAQRAGYAVEDEYYYPLRYLRELLEIYYVEGVSAHPPRGRAESVSKGGQDPAEGGGHLTAMLDVQRGLQSLPRVYRQRLALRFGFLAGLSDDKIANLAQSDVVRLTGLHPDQMRKILGVTRDGIRHRTATALKALQTQLGGPSPWRVAQVAG